MARYLSPEWLDALQRLAAADAGLAAATAGISLCVQHRITGGPEGDTAFFVSIDDGVVQVAAGETESSTVTFEQAYGTAVGVARGELSAQGAFMLGLIRVRGDLPALVQHRDAFAGLDDVFATVRTETEY